MKPHPDPAEQLASLAAQWMRRIDGFCAQLEADGFRVEREGLDVRIVAPAAAVSDCDMSQSRQTPEIAGNPALGG